jgi:predicted ATP-dependent endonuclease of OLD family
MIDRTDNDPLYLEQKSKGFRWFSSFNLHLRALGVKDSTIKKLVILIDEPGQGLHEKAQKDLKNVLEELAKKGAQIIYTTHYPNLIGTVGKEFSRIRLVSNTISHGTKVDTVAKFASQSNDAALDALSPIITAMGIQSVGQFITKNQYNIVVEGITDHYYLSALAKIFENDFEFNFLPACGVSNVCNLVSVLIGWGLNYKAIFDDDAGSGRKAYNLMKKEFYEGSDEEAHKHVFKISGCIGIEDVFSQKDFYKHILNLEVLPDNVQQPNSKLAEGRKEPLARIFLQKVEAGEKIKFDENTSKRVKEIFIWLRKSFFLLEKNDASIPTIS